MSLDCGFSIQYPANSSISCNSRNNDNEDDCNTALTGSVNLHRACDIPGDTVVVTIRQAHWKADASNLQKRKFLEGLEDVGRVVSCLTTLKRIVIVHALDIELFKKQISPRRRFAFPRLNSINNAATDTFPVFSYSNRTSSLVLPRDTVATPILDLECESVILKHARQITKLKVFFDEHVYERSEFLNITALADALICHPTLESVAFPPEMIQSLAAKVKQDEEDELSSGHRALQFALLSLPKLKEMEHPELFDDDLLGSMICKPSLKKVSFQANLFRDQRSGLIETIISALGTNPGQKLDHLDLIGFPVTPELCLALLRVLRAGSLKHLAIDGIKAQDQWLMLIASFRKSDCFGIRTLKLVGRFASRSSDMSIGNTILCTVGTLLNKKFPLCDDFTASFPEVKCPFTSVTNFLLNLEDGCKIARLQLDFNVELNSWPKHILPAIQSNCALTQFKGNGLTTGTGRGDCLLSHRLRTSLQGILRMNQAGRGYILKDPRNKLQGVEVLSSVNRTSLDCVYLHLLENPFLCKQEDENDTQERKVDNLVDQNLELLQDFTNNFVQEYNIKSSQDVNTSAHQDFNNSIPQLVCVDEKGKEKTGYINHSCFEDGNTEIKVPKKEKERIVEEQQNTVRVNQEHEQSSFQYFPVKNPNGSFHGKQKRKLPRLESGVILNLALTTVICIVGMRKQAMEF